MILFEQNNFLGQTEFRKSFKDVIESDFFPWFYNPVTADGNIDDLSDINNYSFAHTGIAGGESNSFMGEKFKYLTHRLEDVSEIPIKEILRVRIGMILRNHEQIIHDPHVDFLFPHMTAIFYLNDCDAPTVMYDQIHPEDKLEEQISGPFEEKQRINSEENKIVVFDGLNYHSSTTPLNSKRRIVININFFPE